MAQRHEFACSVANVHGRAAGKDDRIFLTQRPVVLTGPRLNSSFQGAGGYKKRKLVLSGSHCRELVRLRYPNQREP